MWRLMNRTTTPACVHARHNSTLRGVRLLLALAPFFLCAAHVAHAQAAAVGAELSRGVSWEPYGPDTRSVGVRRLNPAEVRLARQRADGFYAAFIAARSFSMPRDRAHSVISYAAIERPRETNRSTAPVLQQTISAYWSVPRDMRRNPDGVLTPKLGGSHEGLSFELNYVPKAEQLADRATAGDFNRGGSDLRHGGYFAKPRVLGEMGGGTVYADVIVLTRDGSSVLEPAPIGELLDLEIVRLTKRVAEIERGFAENNRSAEASMTPEKVAERRAKRAAAWQRETRDASAMTQRLDAAHRTDLADVERTRASFTIPKDPDPRHAYWGLKLALNAAEQLAASLGTPGRRQPACARVEPGFLSGNGVRFVVAGSTADCVPMMQVRADLLDPKTSVTDVQLMTVHFRDSKCGEVIGGARPMPNDTKCAYGVPLLREMDWSAARRAMGWP